MTKLADLGELTMSRKLLPIGLHKILFTAKRLCTSQSSLHYPRPFALPIRLQYYCATFAPYMTSPRPSLYMPYTIYNIGHYNIVSRPSLHSPKQSRVRVNPTRLPFGLYTILPLPILYGVWHTQGRVVVGRVLCNGRATALQLCGRCTWEEQCKDN